MYYQKQNLGEYSIVLPPVKPEIPPYYTPVEELPFVGKASRDLPTIIVQPKPRSFVQPSSEEPNIVTAAIDILKPVTDAVKNLITPAVKPDTSNPYDTSNLLKFNQKYINQYVKAETDKQKKDHLWLWILLGVVVVGGTVYYTKKKR